MKFLKFFLIPCQYLFLLLNPIFEFDRIYDVIYSSFYILANIDAMNNDTEKALRSWIALEKPPNTNAKEMDVWLIDQHLNSAYAKGTKAQIEYHSIIGRNHIENVFITESKWNAIWSINDPMLKRGNIDTSTLKTIEVLSVPQSLQWEEAQIDQLVSLFDAN